jgi:protein-glutamine gamma-glutamyltransferase
MLEPHGRNWLFGLDTVRSTAQRGARIEFDHQLRIFRPVTSALSYEAESYLETRYTKALSINGRKIDTRLPVSRNPRTLALAAKLRGEFADDESYTRAVLNYFRRGGFEYTLTPPLLNYDSIDDLLFNTRLGFCGHFASAYVTLLRAGGVPARVVTGYLGGEWNSAGGYFLIRQSDAHAWAEHWVDGRGWVRVDPTAVVAPERLRRGLRDLLPESGSVTSRFIHDSPLLRTLLQRWDATNNWWQQRVVNFNQGVQLDLLRKLGLDDIDYRQMALLLIGGTAAWIAIAFLWFARRPRSPRIDAVGRSWLRFIALLRRQGLHVADHEAPRSVAHRAAAHLPHAAAPIGDFAQRYLALRYGATPPTDEAITTLRATLKQLLRGTHSR